MCKLRSVRCAHTQSAEPQLAKDEQWLETFDFVAFTDDIRILGKQLERNQGKEDVDHLNKMVAWSNMCAFSGIVTMGFKTNIFTAFLLSLWTFTRWLVIAHHACHGGYDNCHPSNRWHRLRFGIGSRWRRICDWLDWLMPEAWNTMHNNKHHFSLSEVGDPDLLEENMHKIRSRKCSPYVKYFFIFISMCIWKWMVYAPRQYFDLKLSRLRRVGIHVPDQTILSQEIRIFKVGRKQYAKYFSFWEFFSVVMAPYLVIHFMILPLPYIFVGQLVGRQDMYMNAIKHLLFAEILTNIHSFITIIPNHCGSDVYRFREGCRPHSGSFYLRALIGSANYNLGIDYNAVGTNLFDFLHGFLNYQIEHHLWPKLSTRSYQKAAPHVKALCKKYGLPYNQGGVFHRCKGAISVMTGESHMRWLPEAYEKKFLEIDNLAEKKRRGLVSFK